MENEFTEVAKKLYPGEDNFFSIGDYDPIINHLGKVVIKVDDENYSGDSRVLYSSDNDNFGYLQFGWGSCSGCDALQACDNYEEVGRLIEELQAKVIWKPRQEMLNFFTEHDWEGNYSWHEEMQKLFVAKVIDYLKP